VGKLSMKKLMITFVNHGNKGKVLGFYDFDSNKLTFWENPTDVRSMAGCTETPFGWAVSSENFVNGENVPSLALLDKEFNCYQVYNTTHIIAPHDIEWDGDKLLVASTGNDSIYAIILDEETGKVTREYRVYEHYDGKHDMYHLNSIAIGNAGCVYFSVFGKREKVGKWGLMEHGRILKMWKDKNGELILSDLTQSSKETYFHPHSLTMVDGDLYFCESHRFVFRSLYAPLQAFRCDGYTRGIAYDDKYFYVGISASRNISRSDGTPNEDAIQDVRAGFCVISRNTDDYYKVDLSEYGISEIYDLEVLND
jgi:hypothetical protein